DHAVEGQGLRRVQELLHQRLAQRTHPGRDLHGGVESGAAARRPVGDRTFRYPRLRSRGGDARGQISPSSYRDRGLVCPVNLKVPPTGVRKRFAPPYDALSLKG